MILKIGESDVKVKDIYCEHNGDSLGEKPEPEINIQVSLTHKCNASCKFCIYHSTAPQEPFNIETFKAGLYAIRDKAYIPCVTFTGGETTLELKALESCLSVIQELDPFIHTKVDTNGHRLSELTTLDFWRLSLSRHAALDHENQEIFQSVSISTLEELSRLPDKQKDRLHIDCNLIRGHVDTFEKMLSFMDTLSEVGIRDYGFISLMPVNEYAQVNGIDFTDIGIHNTDRFHELARFMYMKPDNNKPHCECKSFLYTTECGRIATAYARFARDINCEEASLVYINNHWQQGFSGNSLILQK